MLARLLLALAIAGRAHGQAITGAEKQAVGAALEKALGVLSGKVQSGSKFSICMSMFPDGAPANKKDVTWQSCKDLVPSSNRARSALIAKNRQPLTGDQKAQVANALGEALSVMSGKTQSNSVYQSCMELFPDHKPPPDAAKSGSWQACAKELSMGLMQRAMKVLRRDSPLSSEEKTEVGNALTTALHAMQGKGTNQDLWGMCNDMFPDGKRPADMKETDVTWVACQGNLFHPPAGLLSVKRHA